VSVYFLYGQSAVKTKDIMEWVLVLWHLWELDCVVFTIHFIVLCSIYWKTTDVTSTVLVSPLWW